MSYAIEWVVSDLLKACISTIQFSLAIRQTLKTRNSANRHISILCAFSAFTILVWSLTTHDPWATDWRVSITANIVSTASLLETLQYLTLLASIAAYTSVNLRQKAPQWGSRFLSFGDFVLKCFDFQFIGRSMVLVAISSMISLVGVLITSDQIWLVCRQLVIPIVFFASGSKLSVHGSYFLYSISRLYHLIKTLQQQRFLRSLKQESKTTGSQVDHPKSHKTLTIAASSSNLYNNEYSTNTISPRVQSSPVNLVRTSTNQPSSRTTHGAAIRDEGANKRPFHHSSPRFAPRQLLKDVSADGEIRQATSCNGGGGGDNISQTKLGAASDNRKSEATML
eukprot:jgi/Bigna1/77745/fgenesh1_pg.50_\